MAINDVITATVEVQSLEELAQLAPLGKSSVWTVAEVLSGAADYAQREALELVESAKRAAALYCSPSNPDQMSGAELVEYLRGGGTYPDALTFGAFAPQFWEMVKAYADSLAA